MPFVTEIEIDLIVLLPDASKYFLLDSIEFSLAYEYANRILHPLERLGHYLRIPIVFARLCDPRTLCPP